MKFTIIFQYQGCPILGLPLNPLFFEHQTFSKIIEVAFVTYRTFTKQLNRQLSKFTVCERTNNHPQIEDGLALCKIVKANRQIDDLLHQLQRKLRTVQEQKRKFGFCQLI
jgi:hypothetical protein